MVDMNSGKMNDLTPWDIDCPHFSLGGSQDIAFSPDGKEIAVVYNPDRDIVKTINHEKKNPLKIIS